MASNIPPADAAPAEYDFHLPDVFDKTISFVGREISLNSLPHYIIAIAIAVIGIALIWAVKGVIARAAEKWLASAGKQRVDSVMAHEVGTTFVSLLYLFPLYVALDTLQFSSAFHSLLNFLLMVFFTVRTVRFLSALASFLTDAYLRRHAHSADSAVGKALTPIIRVLFWTLGITIILDNMGFQISSLLAGLGIMGVAVGLAGQTILADFFGYLVILMDRPFSIGDFITLDNGSSGTVESIGLKTTRLRALGGEILVCPNGDITKQNIQNFRLMARRARTFTFGIAYETPPVTVRAVPDIVRTVAKNISGLDITRVFFTEFGDSSLNFEVVFSVRSRVLDDALAAQQELFLGLLDAFAAQGIIFSYPTRTVYFANAMPER
ncbi:MAG: hypothetical protein DELT_01117 [Desulfovibrio sp.]